MPESLPLPDPFHALLLDLDGTLVDSEHIHRSGYESWLAARDWTGVDPQIFTGRRAGDVLRSTPGPWSGHDLDALVVEIESHVDADAVPVAVPGAVELVRAAAARGIAMAVVTSAWPEWADQVLTEVLEVGDLLPVRVTAADVAEGKPHPRGYALGAERLGIDPAACVTLEDTPAGLLAARDAGVGTRHGITTTHTAEQLLAADADAVHDDLRELAAQLAR